MQRIYSPTSESELIFLQSLLDAYDVPYVLNQGFGAALPGLYIDSYTRKWIMVPDEEAERAYELIQSHLQAPVDETEEPETNEPPQGWLGKLRIVLEALLFGWFVPSQRRRK